MSLFSWLSPRKKRQSPAAESSGLSRLDSTKPFSAAPSAATATPGNRKQERLARRELLYGVVREAMVRAGVLSSSYKFKVLSLDSRGRQFLVMVDLAQGAGAETTQLAEIEAMVAQTAKHRHDILVSAVYWRSNEHVAVGEPEARGQPQRPPVSRPAPLRPEPAASTPVPLAAVPAAVPVLAAVEEEISRPAELHAEPPRANRGFEPLQADEVAAFKRALALGVSGPEAMAAAHPGGGKQPPQSYTLLTGFEDTEMFGSPEEVERLSGSQYGELR